MGREQHIEYLKKNILNLFIAEFPFRYGYQKKYAKQDSSLGYIEKVVEVFEQGANAMAYSVYIILHYGILDK